MARIAEEINKVCKSSFVENSCSFYWSVRGEDARAGRRARRQEIVGQDGLTKPRMPRKMESCVKAIKR